MNLNPFSLIEKLINEHASAAVLKERLALGADQFTSLERKNVELLAQVEQSALKIGVLESDNTNLRSLVDQKQNEIDRLTEQIKQAQQSKNERRTKKEDFLLQVIAIQEGQDIANLAKQLRTDLHTAEYNIEELRRASLIEMKFNRFLHIEEWYLTHQGQGYLIKNGILPKQSKASS